MSEPNTIRINEVDYVRKDSLPAPYTKRKEGPWEIGECYAIRTITMINHGRLVDLTETDFVLTNAAWIADTGRWADFVSARVQPNEVEPFPPNAVVLVSRAAYVDAVKLPAKFATQK